MEMTINLKEPINKTWKDLLLKYTDYTDMGVVCQETGVGFYTLKRLRLGEIKIANEENKKAVEALAAKAIENAEKQKLDTGSDLLKMAESIGEIFIKEDKQAIIDAI